LETITGTLPSNLKLNTEISSSTFTEKSEGEIKSPLVAEKELEILKYSSSDDLELPGLIPTNTKFDELISDRFTTDEELVNYKEEHGEEMPLELIEQGGFTRQCADITAGRAGSGKTLTKCSLAALAKKYHRERFSHKDDFKELKVVFISAEMRESEWKKEIKACNLLMELDVVYMLDYVGQSNYEDILWQVIKDSDISIMDSFPAVLSHIRMNPNEKRTEKAIMFDMIRKINDKVREGNSNLQIINQANKDGNYKGGTELPHMLSSLSFVNLDGRRRYTVFDKNRNNGGDVKKKLYINRNEDTKEIEFDVDLFNTTYNAKLDKEESLSSFLSNLNKDETFEDTDAVKSLELEDEETAEKLLTESD
jgi:hypothetical protein